MIQQLRRPTLIVVGTGMAGAKVVEEVLKRDPDRFDIRMFGAEPHGTYNRILLSTYLGGFEPPERLWLNSREWYEERGIHLHAGVKVDTIQPNDRVVVGGRGKVVEPYDILVLATGSRAFVPPISGTDKRGVFVFRTLEDCEKIAAFADQCDRAVVLGGGLLGLEAARGLVSFDLDVTVVEMAPHLMPQQLDATGGRLLQRKMKDMGVQSVVNAKAEAFLGNDIVTGVRLSDGTVLETDLIVISCGIQPNVDEARAAGLAVDRAVIVDDQMRSSEEDVFAVGECAQHRGKVYGLVDPIYEQARVLADVLTEKNSHAKYRGSVLHSTLKVMGVDLTSMGEVNGDLENTQVVNHADSANGIYKKFVIREERLAGAILLGVDDVGGKVARIFKNREMVESPSELLATGNARDALLEQGADADLLDLPDDTQICNCNEVSKKTILNAVADGKKTVTAVGKCTKAGTGCGTCQPIISQLVDAATGKAGKKNKVEAMKEKHDGLNIADDLRPLMHHNNWQEMTEDHKQMAKWRGLFFRKPTPGHFMLRLRMNAGQTNSEQFRVIAGLSDEYGKGFCDLTTRQQIQMRWFTLSDVSDIWERLEAVGLNSKQTGHDNIRGVCGCPVSGLTPHELFDAQPVVREFTDIIVDNREFTNLPRKFNVTITGCLENCCHTETQDVALVPAYREMDGAQVNGFNVFVGGKQGSGGYTPAKDLDVFIVPKHAAQLCAEIARVFRDHGSRKQRNRARLAFLIEDRGIAWFRAELERRVDTRLVRAGTDLRKKHHVDHLGIHSQKTTDLEHDSKLHYIGALVPVGRITTQQMRAVADVADTYGDGSLRLTAGQNIIIPNIPEAKIGAASKDPIFQELRFDPSPIMRGLVTCTGNDFCAMALVDTKGYALQIAKELEERLPVEKLKPLTMHWSGCSAGCGLHQVASIGFQGCRSRVDGNIVDAAHVCINGSTGPNAKTATDVLYDVPISKLTGALESLVEHLPRKAR